MHRLIENHLEGVLTEGALPEAVEQHLRECKGCREEVGLMQEHTALLREFSVADNVTDELEPRPGFYARVWERIEQQRPVSIWGLFTDSVWGRRLAAASLSVALVMGAYVVSSERTIQGVVSGGDSMEQLLPGGGFPLTASVDSSPNAVFMDLVSHRDR